MLPYWRQGKREMFPNAHLLPDLGEGIRRALNIWGKLCKVKQILQDEGEQRMNAARPKSMQGNDLLLEK